MKLHTDFHDYYDTAIGYGVDSNVHYNRFTKEIEAKLKFKLDFPRVFWDTSPFLLGFCGEIFPMLRYVRRDENHQVVEYFYAYIISGIPRQVRRMETKIEKEIRKVFFPYDQDRREAATKRFFIDWRKRDDSIFLENKVPVWIYHLDSYNHTAILNPNLKSYQFYRVKDAFTTFQEISMYLSNILVEQKETAAIEDKYRIEQHGFDLKTSFRKEKQK